ncbi:unnamed protein product [Chironomus riparius]|uniref:C2 domain-containing protein n=1 Tax=Chironomus riparius TaxID=315576 RepID=A0A9N9RYW7_9DIPT|nr:unnamed protein product [Chironomus riparius]
MRKMSVCEKSENYSLPPYVSGKLHGFCELFIDEIKWTTTKTYNTVKILIKFWGESRSRIFEKVEIKRPESNKSLKYSAITKNSKTILTATYKVCTNNQLFQSYLKNSEPIQIEIFSAKTADLIGKLSVKIPEELYNLENKASSQVYVDILSNRNFKLGEIKISFEVKLNINCCTMMDVTQPIVSLKINPEKDVCKENQKFQKSIKISKSKAIVEENKENLQGIACIGNKMAITVRESKPKKPFLLKTKQTSINHRRAESNKSTTTSSISEKEIYMSNKHNLSEGIGKLTLINYLRGQQMTSSEENRILSDLLQLSPTQSLIDGIRANSAKVSSKPVSKRDESKCLKVLINVLELNEIGYEDVKHYFNNFSNAKFIFKCALTSKLFGKSKENFNFLSSISDLPSHRIVFANDLVRNIKLSDDSINTYLNFGFCMKTVNYSYSSFRVIGFSRVKIEEVLRNNYCFFKKCPVLNENDVRVGSVTLKIEITDLNIESHSVYTEYRPPATLLSHQRLKTTSHPSTSNDDCENMGERNFDKSMQTDENEMRSKGSRKENRTDDNRDTEMVDVEAKDSIRKAKVYQGILFIEGLKSSKDQKISSEYFITYDGFWNECQEMTEVSVSNILNYLKQFAVIFDSEFLKKVQNNFMELKLWEKTNEKSEKLIATTRVPLHQFYIAFKDIEMIEHLSTNKLPVISTDAWCNFVTPLSSELLCQAKILLAIGSENQIDFLKLSRNLHNLQPPQKQELKEHNNSSSPYDPNAQIKSKLTAFIESLSQKLPEPSTAVIQQKFSAPSVSSNSSVGSQSSQPQLRKTSELLDTLQKALSQPPPQSDLSLFQAHTEHSDMSISSATPNNDSIKINVTIEHAANLPKVIVKKCRNNKRKNKGTTPQKAEFDPHTYATFEATTDHLNEKSLPQNTIKSHEGIVYCTKVVRSTNPEWNQSFEVYVPFDVLKNPQKKFVIKVWRKPSHDPQKIEPSPFEDSVIGFSAIDLSVLLTGLPVLSGYYNVIDFNGRSNGQIKITLKPLDDVNKFRNPSSPLVPLMQPLSIDISSNESSNDGSNILSRTLKRKFTELDEITQRLRARLFDVTADENLDPDEEFEKDLNTAVDDMDDNEDNLENFGWLKNEDDLGHNLLQQTECFQEDFNKIIESRPSTSKDQSSVPTRQITGCSSETSQFAIDDLLKKYDLDTLINPNIFKNLLDPTLANSDSTPTLNPQPVNKDSNDKDENESDVTTISSISNDQDVKIIQKALQRASLQENSEQSSTRREPEGEINK